MVPQRDAHDSGAFPLWIRRVGVGTGARGAGSGAGGLGPDGRGVEGCELRPLQLLASGRGVGEGRENGVQGRDEEEREDGGEAHAPDDDEADRGASLGARAGGEHQRHRAEDRGDRGHQDRAHADHGGLAGRVLHAHALGAELVGELDEQDAVLGHQADEQYQPDLAVDVERCAGEEQRCKTARDGERRRDEDRDRVNDALELRREGEVHEQEREAESDEELRRGVAVVERLTQIVEHRAGGEVLVGELFQAVESAAEGSAGRGRARDDDGGRAVDAGEVADGSRLFEGDEGIERDERAARGADVDVREVGGAGAVRRACLKDDFVEVALIEVLGDLAPAQECLHGAPDGADVDADVERALAVDAHAELRAGAFEVEAQVLERRVVPRQIEEALRPLGGGLEVRPADGDLDRLAVVADAQPGRVDGDDAGAGDLAELGREGVDDVEL